MPNIYKYKPRKGDILYLDLLLLNRGKHSFCKFYTEKYSTFKVLLNHWCFILQTIKLSVYVVKKKWTHSILQRRRCSCCQCLCLSVGCSPSERLISRVGGQGRSKTPNADMERSVYGADCTSTPTYLNKVTFASLNPIPLFPRVFRSPLGFIFRQLTDILSLSSQWCCGICVSGRSLMMVKIWGKLDAAWVAQ